MQDKFFYRSEESHVSRKNPEVFFFQKKKKQVRGALNPHSSNLGCAASFPNLQHKEISGKIRNKSGKPQELHICTCNYGEGGIKPCGNSQSGLKYLYLPKSEVITAPQQEEMIC